MSERVQLAILGLLGMVILVVGASLIPGAKDVSEAGGRVLDLLVGGLIGALGGYAVRALKGDGGEG